MSHEEEMAARGRLVTEYVEVQQKLAAVESEIERARTDLQEVARNLNADDRTFAQLDLARILDGERLVRLRRDVDELRTHKTNLQARVRALGLEVG